MCFTALGLAVISILLLLVWPGFLIPTRCTSSPSLEGVPTVGFNGRTYCFTTVLVAQPTKVCVPLQNGTPKGQATGTRFWGFSFHLILSTCARVLSLFASVTEPNGTVYNGGLIFGCPEPIVARCAGPWFPPDNESGIAAANPSAGNFTLLVEVGW